MIVYLDSNVVIYAVEQNPLFGPNARTRLATAQASGDELMISDLTLMECLVGPMKTGNAAVEADFHTFFGVTQLFAITRAVCQRAARIRATNNLKQMDSLQLTPAVEHGADVFLTADVRLASFADVTVEIFR